MLEFNSKQVYTDSTIDLIFKYNMDYLYLFHLQVFRYNASDDRLELCLEPLGHFQVCPGVEERSKSAPDWSTLAKQADKHEADAREAAAEQTANKLAELQRTLSAGASGVIVNKAMQIPAAMVAFTGEGHSMLSAGQNSPGQNSPGKIMERSTQNV